MLKSFLPCDAMSKTSFPRNLSKVAFHENHGCLVFTKILYYDT